MRDTFQLILLPTPYLFCIRTFYSVKINNYAADGRLNPPGDSERASDNMTHINHSGEQFMKEKLSVFGMTLEELNRSQFEEETFSPIVQLAFFPFSNCVTIYIFKLVIHWRPDKCPFLC